MDLTTIGGLIGAIISLCIGDFLEGGNPLHLIHISSLIIIIPTALCAATSATHASHVKGVLALEGKAAQIEDDFLRQSLSMIIDGRDAHAVREDMEVQIESLEEYYKGCSHFWILYAETCPTMGLVERLWGLCLLSSYLMTQKRWQQVLRVHLLRPLQGFSVLMRFLDLGDTKCTLKVRI